MNEDISLEGHLALDSSVMVEVLDGSDLGMKVSTSLETRGFYGHASYVNFAESGYVLCRKMGHEKAMEATNALIASNVIVIEENPEIHSIVSRIKCERAISLADCYTFAVAELIESRPVFARREKDLLLEMSRKPFRAEPIFLA